MKLAVVTANHRSFKFQQRLGSISKLLWM